MASISFTDVLTIIYYVVDEWMKGEKAERRVGREARLSDSEVVTLVLAHEYLGYTSERRYVAFIEANYKRLFPGMVSQSQYNRRARGLSGTLERLRQHWLSLLWNEDVLYFIMDTKAIPVLGYKRSKRQSDFWGSATYGRCVSRQLKYWGYKLVMLTTPQGLPVAYDLVPANTSDQAAADEVLDAVHNTAILADKAFIGQVWHQQWTSETDNYVYIPPRSNQPTDLTPDQIAFIHSARQRIEGTFHELANVGRTLERFLAKTIQGLALRLVSKIAAYSLLLVLRLYFRIDVVAWCSC